MFLFIEASNLGFYVFSRWLVYESGWSEYSSKRKELISQTTTETSTNKLNGSSLEFVVVVVDVYDFTIFVGEQFIFVTHKEKFLLSLRAA